MTLFFGFILRLSVFCFMLTPEMYSKKRILPHVITLAFCVIMFAFLLLEILFRLTGIAPGLPKAYADGVYVSDPVLPYRLAPNISRDVLSKSGEFREQFTHNSAGLAMSSTACKSLKECFASLPWGIVLRMAQALLLRRPGCFFLKKNWRNERTLPRKLK